MAREILEVFGALSYSKGPSLMRTSATVSARNSTGFIHLQLAVLIELVWQKKAPKDQLKLLPYHSFLFSQTFAVWLAENVIPSHNRLKLFLSKLDSMKLLSENPHQTAVPIYLTIETAKYLVSNSICIVSQVFDKRSMLACCNDAISRINSLILVF